MKSILCASALLALALPFASRRPQEPEDVPETELAGHMETIEDTVKVLRKNLKDPSTYPQAIDALCEIERLLPEAA